jgi:hypothetical protein
MERRALAGLVVGLMLAVPTGAQAHGGLTLQGVTGMPASAAGPAAQPYGYLSLHPQELARAKAAAEAKGGGGKPGGGGNSGGPTVFSPSNVTPSFNALNQSGLTPPDTTGAIGPDRYIETINTKYGIYTRSGSLLNSGSLSQLTGISGGIFGYSLSDPQMMWDAATQRFYYSTVYYDAFLSDTGLALGWSKTATPASSSDFCRYRIGFGNDLPDYPKLGDSQDLLMYGYNLFLNGNSYDGSEFATLNKPGPGSTCPAASSFHVDFWAVAGESTPVPANKVDDAASNGAGYVVTAPDVSGGGSASHVSVWTVTTADPTAAIKTANIPTVKHVTVNAFSVPPNAPQAGSSFALDTLDGRLEAAVAATDPAHGSVTAVWTAHAVAGGGGSEERWYEIDPSTGGLVQPQGAVSDASLDIWNGAISPDRGGGSTGGAMAMSVSTSSTATDPAIRFVTKNGDNAQSSLTSLVQSTGPNVDFSCSSTAPCRWGDYSGASPDPNPGSTTVGRVWLGNQYNVAGGSTSGTAWRTWLFGVTPTG